MLECLEINAQLTINKSLVVEKVRKKPTNSGISCSDSSRTSDLELLTLLHLCDFVLKLAKAAEDSSDIVISLVAKAQA